MLDAEKMNVAAIRAMDEGQLQQLCAQIREELVRLVSQNGGHLASNLGTVELTIALHRVFDTPKDKLIWDVGHQSYVHKMLTGRLEQMDTLRRLDGVCGFPRRAESPHDCFDTGHSSTSLSAAMGFAHARELRGTDERIVAIIGDGALTGGMAYEALNEIGRSQKKIIILLNDNEMSISRNVGAMSLYLSRARSRKGYLRFKKAVSEYLPALKKPLSRVRDIIKFSMLHSHLFEELGIKYLGPVDGHDIEDVEAMLRRAENFEGPVLIHVLTQKGKGYEHAERNPAKFHGIAPFEVQTGNVLGNKRKGNSQVFGETLCQLAREDQRIVGITAAMRDGTGLKDFAREFPDRFFDVGIAEGHAATMAAGCAAGGLRPVFAVYSSFLQRAYDQVIHDICLQNLPVVLGVDRSGIVGEDGSTHHGLYDIPMLTNLPNMAVFSPASQQELQQMLKMAFSRQTPCALRYPRSALPQRLEGEQPVLWGKWQLQGEIQPVMLIATGDMVENALQAAELLKNEGICCSVINARFLRPMDEELLEKLRECRVIYTMENGVIAGGMGEHIARFLEGLPVHCFGIDDRKVPAHGSVKELLARCGLDAESLAQQIQEDLKKR